MAAMRVRAIGVTPYDLAAGADFLKNLAQQERLPLVSANLIDKENGKPVFSPYLLTNAGQTRIAVFGLTGQLQNTSEKVSLRPWQDVLPHILEEISAKSDMIILLSSLPQQINKQIAKQYKTIHIIIQSGQFTGNIYPKIINNTLLCQTGAKGKYLGILDIRWNRGHQWQPGKQQDPKALQSRLDRVVWQLQRLRKRHQEKELAANTYYLRLEKEKKRLEEILADLNRRSTDQAQPDCSYENTFLAIETSLPQESKVRAIIEQTRREVNRLNRELRKKQRLTDEKIGQTFSGMAGKNRCKECHPSQVAFYLRTDHARAWQTLTRRDQQYNPDCIACHATLPDYGTATVQDEALLTSLPARFHNVGCEACHGPSLAHANEPDSNLPGQPKAATCRQCHTAKHDPAFDYERKVPRIRCPAG